MISVGDLPEGADSEEEEEEAFDIGEAEGLPIKPAPKEDRIYSYRSGDIVEDLAEGPTTFFYKPEEAPLGASELIGPVGEPDVTEGDPVKEVDEEAEIGSPEDEDFSHLEKIAGIKRFPFYKPKGFKLPAWYGNLYDYLEEGTLGLGGIGVAYSPAFGHIRRGYGKAEELMRERSRLVEHLQEEILPKLKRLKEIVDEQRRDLMTAMKAPEMKGLKKDVEELEDRLKTTWKYFKLYRKDRNDTIKAIDELDRKLVGPHYSEEREKPGGGKENPLLDRPGPWASAPAGEATGTGTAYDHIGHRGTSHELATGQKGLIHEIKQLSKNYLNTRSALQHLDKQQSYSNDAEREIELLLAWRGVYPEYNRREQGGRLYPKVNLKTVTNKSSKAKGAAQAFIELKKEQLMNNAYVPSVEELERISEDPGSLYGQDPWVDQDFGPPTLHADLDEWQAHIIKRIRGKKSAEDKSEAELDKDEKEYMEVWSPFEKAWNAGDKKKAVEQLPEKFKKGSPLHPTPTQMMLHDPSAFYLAEELYTELTHPGKQTKGVIPPGIDAPKERWLGYLSDAGADKDVVEKFKETWEAAEASAEKSNLSDEEKNRRAATLARDGLPARFQKGIEPAPPKETRPLHYFLPEEFDIISKTKVAGAANVKEGDLISSEVPTVQSAQEKEKRAQELAEAYAKKVFSDARSLGKLAKHIEWLLVNQENRIKAVADAKRNLKSMLVKRNTALEKDLEEVGAKLSSVSGSVAKTLESPETISKEDLAKIIVVLKEVKELLDNDRHPAEVDTVLPPGTYEGLQNFVDGALAAFAEKDIKGGLKQIAALDQAYKHIEWQRPIISDLDYMKALHRIFEKYAARALYDDAESFIDSFGGGLAVRMRDTYDKLKAEEKELQDQIDKLQAERDRLLEPVHSLEEALRGALRIPDAEEAQKIAQEVLDLSEQIRGLKDQRWTRIKLKEAGQRIGVPIEIFDEKIKELSHRRDELLQNSPEQSEDVHRIEKELMEAQEVFDRDSVQLNKDIEELEERRDKITDRLLELRSDLGEK